ncbi:MAG: hypothetical protein IH584_02915, partial [Candidatus Aminicenantes bacterium]|nr:hypothetical protein [Candidatus Aminicenantes bacterium]
MVNQGLAPQALNLKWTLNLAQPQGRVRWLIPGLFYKENQQQYDGGLPSVAGTPDLAKSRWPNWTLRADLMAVPMVMAWTDSGSVAPVLRETFRRWDDRHGLRPWYPTSEAATHAAHGLFTWHFDREV